MSPCFTDEKAKTKSPSVHPPALDPWLEAWAPKQESELLQRAAGSEHALLKRAAGPEHALLQRAAGPEHAHGQESENVHEEP